jgi:hypothetical protein
MLPSRISSFSEGHTDNVDIHAVFDEEFHNVRAASSRRIMQCGVVGLIYLSVENEADLEMGSGTYR